MPRGRPKKQSTLQGQGFLPRLSHPESIIGKVVSVPGEFWSWPGATEEQLAEDYPTIVHAFDCIHKWAGSRAPCAAYQLECTNDTGGGTGEMLWVAYPDPFLKFYYKSYPVGGSRKGSAIGASYDASPGAAAHSGDASGVGTPGEGNNEFVAAAGEAQESPTDTRRKGVYLHISQPTSSTVLTTGPDREADRQTQANLPL